jgi:hypothetical protein
VRTFTPLHASDAAPNVRVFDLGQNFSGVPALVARGPAGATIKLTTGELLDPETGLVSQKNTGQPVSFSYTLRGSGSDEHWHPRFSLTGFRYLQAEGDLDALRSVSGAFIHAAVPVVGHFVCSNVLLNRIHELILAAIRCNMHGVFTDCPHREKLGWLEQTHLMGPSVLYNFVAAPLYAKIARDIADAQHASGLVPTIAPQYTTFSPPWDMFNDSPEWGSAAVLNPWIVYQFTGDDRLLRDNFDVMRRYVAYLASRADADGIVNYGLADWYDIGEKHPGFSNLTSAALTATAVYYADLRVLSRAADLLDQRDEALRLAGEAERVRRGFNARLFDPSSATYDRGSQTAQAMPLALGLVDDAHRSAVLEKLVQDVREHDNHFTAGDVGLKFVIAALSEAGRSDVVYDVLTRTDAPSYGYQLARGATTLTEAWDANPRVSQNHFMLGHAEAWFYEHLAGIRIDYSRPKGAQIGIRPAVVGDVTWVEAKHETREGRTEVRWDRQGNRVALEATIPDGQTARVFVPGAGEPLVCGGGRHRWVGRA